MAPDSSAFERIKPFIRMLEGSIDRARSERLERERVSRDNRAVAMPAQHRLNSPHDQQGSSIDSSGPSDAAAAQMHAVSRQDTDQGWLIGS
ncbi:MAG: hypothetical protein D8M59_00705 [Planctomycetes bacterium]|nr:hypothetical protein [Planctomycetota bacterium]NOG54758.1 hypothetical protein [Planctomycetota bacterium]